jgi:TolB protein
MARSGYLAAAAIGLAFLALALPASAAFPGRNGKIAFIQRASGEVPSIHVMNGDGSHQHRLARHGEDPSFSATGKRIAFDRRGDIYVMRADGSHKRRVTHGPAVDVNPSFSPSGRRIVFVRRHGAPADVFAIRGDGSHLKRLTARHIFGGDSEFDPEYSPNGKWIVVAGCDIWILRERTTHPRQHRLTHDGCVSFRDINPDFSPNGRRILFVSREEGFANGGTFYMMRSDGTHLRSVGVFGTHPAFSPNGKRIVFAARPMDPNQATRVVYTMRADGSDLKGPLTDKVSDETTWGPRN